MNFNFEVIILGCIASSRFDCNLQYYDQLMARRIARFYLKIQLMKNRDKAKEEKVYKIALIYTKINYFGNYSGIKPISASKLFFL
jgi:hypothetical protein